jgi:hypothetical protein
MYVLDNVSFICHPNTGSRSLKQALRRAGSVEVLSHHEVCPWTVAQTRACVCVIRNPFTLMGSWYCRGNIEKPFSVWLENTLKADRNHEGPRELGLFYGTLWASHVLRFESLQADLDVACEELGLPQLPLDHIGKNRRPLDYRRMYWAEPETKNMVTAAYSFHLNRFNYKL